ncbi:MAG TPA: hypothetical protein VIX82_15550, partial [Solirubrobacteraceae bacterium]
LRLLPTWHFGLPTGIHPMTISSAGLSSHGNSTISADLGRCILGVLWHCVRLPVFLLLVVLEPVVTFALGSLALLGVLTAFFWKFFGPPHFPFLLVLGISLGFELVLLVYYKLLRWLSA